MTNDNDNVDLNKDEDAKKDVESTSCQTEEPRSSNLSWNFLKFKKSSKYCVNSERAEKGNLCFWFVQKIFD